MEFILNYFVAFGSAMGYTWTIRQLRRMGYEVKVPNPTQFESFEEAGAYVSLMGRPILVQVGEKVGRLAPSGEFQNLTAVYQKFGGVVNVSSKDESKGKPK